MKREQRWRERKERWVAPADRPLFDPAGFEVRPVAEGPARAFVEAHHYSGSYPAARVRSGVFDPHGELVGVAVFSVGMNPRTLPSYFGPGVEGVELGRFVLTDELGYNAETWVLRRAFAQLRRELPEVRGVLAFSDPVPRKTWLGEVVTPGHVGTIYKAFGGRLLGRSEARTRYLDLQGREVSLRGLGKVRGPRSEQEFRREVERLVAAGAPPPRRDEEAAAWVRRALASGAFEAIRHPGNLAYAWSVAGREFELPERRWRDLGQGGGGRGAGARRQRPVSGRSKRGQERNVEPCREVAKSQAVRVLDVAVLGPGTMLAAAMAESLPTWSRVALAGYGAATAGYNLRNLIATHKANRAPARGRGTANIGDLVGWRVARYAGRDGKEEAVSGADSRLRWPLRIGAVHTAPRAGIFLGLSRQYVLDHYAVHDHNVLLKYRFREVDIRQGNLEDREPELGVSRATLVGWWAFTDEEPLCRASDKHCAFEVSC